MNNEAQTYTTKPSDLELLAIFRRSCGKHRKNEAELNCKSQNTHGSLAQMEEQEAFNLQVACSIHARLTTLVMQV